MKIQSLIVLAGIIGAGASFGATGIFGAYLTVAGTKYKSSSTYAGGEPTFNGANLGTLTVGSSSILSQAETLTFQNSGHSTFGFALAYRVRPNASPQSTNPSDYIFRSMGDGVGFGGGGDEKGEFTSETINFMSGITTNGIYAVDIVHKVGAFEGGSNFERLANVNNPNPGGTNWAGTDAFTANFTVVPEPASAMLGLIGSVLLLRRRRM